MSYVPDYAPPSGQPLGTNKYFRFASWILIPLLDALTKRNWQGRENIPSSGPVIVASNHVSYVDALVLTHFLFKNGRAPRFLGKEAVFRVPIIGKIIAGSGQIPVLRESDEASDALQHALAFLRAGHCVGVYPEGTLTRDDNLWPMVAKTGIARLALISQAPVIPCAQWGDHELLPRYSKKLVFWRRTKIAIIAGAPVDLSRWYGKAEDQKSLEEATAAVMGAITALLEGIRGESAPAVTFDPRTSDLPRTGNFKKSKN
jgi:1-acyl-sn-glycerol-3-phosphate acyltransferase